MYLIIEGIYEKYYLQFSPLITVFLFFLFHDNIKWLIVNIVRTKSFKISTGAVMKNPEIYHNSFLITLKLKRWINM